MVIRINSNIASAGAQRQLAKTTDELSTTFERLSSGLRINHASDDPAGLAMSASLHASNRVLAQAVRNVNDGISVLTIADGAVQELSGIVDRLKELATQAASGTYSTTQRSALDTEAQSLVSEYNRILGSTSYNGTKLLDGSYGTKTIQSNSGTLDLSIGSYIAVPVGDGTFNASTSYSDAAGSLDLKTGDVTGDGVVDLVTIGTSGVVSILAGNGDGTFKARTSIAAFAAGESAAFVNLFDINHDGSLDIVGIVGGTDKVSVLLNNGDGTFKAGISFTPNVAAGNLSQATVGDFNSDGNLDLLVDGSNFGTRVTLYFGNSDGTFNAAISVVSADPGDTLATGDFNGDGKLDFVAGDSFLGRVIPIRNLRLFLRFLS